MTNLTMNQTKFCKGCCKDKPRNEFNNSKGWADGKHQYCILCHRLWHKALVVAAHRAGYTGRKKWMKDVSVEQRKPLLAEVFKQLLAEAYGDKPASRLSRPAPRIAFDAISEKTRIKLVGVRAKHQEELNELNNTQCTLKEGFVYAITNPAWPGTVKVGKAINYENRTGTYQTYDPYRKYSIEGAWHFEDREKAEKYIHKLLDDKRIYDDGEWFKASVDDVKALVEHCQKENNLGNHETTH